jgi:hypothetical protein
MPSSETVAISLDAENMLAGSLRPCRVRRTSGNAAPFARVYTKFFGTSASIPRTFSTTLRTSGYSIHGRISRSMPLLRRSVSGLPVIEHKPENTEMVRLHAGIQVLSKFMRLNIAWYRGSEP